MSLGKLIISVLYKLERPSTDDYQSGPEILGAGLLDQIHRLLFISFSNVHADRLQADTTSSLHVDL